MNGKEAGRLKLKVPPGLELSAFMAPKLFKPVAELAFIAELKINITLAQVLLFKHGGM